MLSLSDTFKFNFMSHEQVTNRVLENHVLGQRTEGLETEGLPDLDDSTLLVSVSSSEICNRRHWPSKGPH